MDSRSSTTNGFLGQSFRQLSLLLFVFAIFLPSGEGSRPLQEESEKFFSLPLGGTITLENRDGSIHVYGWYRSHVRLAALRKAYTASRLHQIVVETEVQPASLTIRTTIPEASGFFGDRSGTVDYSLSVPETARLYLKQANGEITLQGLRGAQVEIEIQNGRVTALNCYAQVRAHAVHGVMEVFFEWWENLPTTFAYVLGHGRIGARLPRDARFRVNARTAHGRIHHDFPLPAPVQEGAGQSLAGATAPQAPVSLGLTTEGGNISLDTIR